MNLTSASDQEIIDALAQEKAKAYNSIFNFLTVGGIVSNLSFP